MADFLKDMFGWGSQATHATPLAPLDKNPRGYCDFRPQLFFQEVQTWHLAGSALEFKMNFETGVNQARFANSEVDLEAAGSEEKLRVAIQNATAVVNMSQSEGDEAEVTKRLVNAVTWQNTLQIRYILRSCYVTQEAALAALAEASSNGLEECVRLLLSAGASPSCCPRPLPLPLPSLQRNALHIACERGHEACAVLLIDAMQSREDIYLQTSPAGMTAFDLLRQQDLCGMARRLQQHADNHIYLQR